MGIFYNRGQETLKRQNLRTSMTDPERKLWSRIRRKQLNGCKFRRQYSIGPYIVDFYCPELRLAVEIDGDSHFGVEAELYDHERQDYIESCGIRFLRFTNDEVMNNINTVIENVRHALHK